MPGIHESTTTGIHPLKMQQVSFYSLFFKIPAFLYFLVSSYE